ESLAKLVPGDPFVALDEVPGRAGLALLLVGLAFALAGAVARVRGRPSPRLVLVVALALATPIGALVYSAAGSSIFAARNLLASLPASACCSEPSSPRRRSACGSSRSHSCWPPFWSARSGRS